MDCSVRRAFFRNLRSCLLVRALARRPIHRPKLQQISATRSALKRLTSAKAAGLIIGPPAAATFRLRSAAWPLLAPLAPVGRRPPVRRAAAAAVHSMGQLFSRPGSVLRAQHRGASAASAAAAEEDLKGDIWIVAGLGNPGPRYAGNRHNVGFMAVDVIAARQGVKLNKVQHNALVARCEIEGQRVLLAKPFTFMNNSGEAVGKLARFYKVPASRCLIVYDDMDIAPAAVRLRAKGGHGGHNGMRSLVQHLKGNEFPRIRIGVGRPPPGQSVIQYVLADFSSEEQKEIAGAIGEVEAILRTVMKLGMERALSGTRV